MNILGMGPGELIMIAMIGLIIFGPDKLPEIATQIGRVVRDIRRSTADVTREFHEAMEPIKELAELPKAIGAGAVFAQKSGTAAAEAEPIAPAQTDVATVPEPPLADTTEWHWENSSDSAANGQPDQLEAPAAASFWDWDSAQLAAEPAAVVESVAAADAVWQWDADPPSGAGDLPPTTAVVTVADEPPSGATAALPVAVANGEASNGEVVPSSVTVVRVVDDAAADSSAEPKPRRRKKAVPAEDAV